MSVPQTMQALEFAMPEPAQILGSRALEEFNSPANKRSLWATYYHVWFATSATAHVMPPEPLSASSLAAIPTTTTANAQPLLTMSNASFGVTLTARDWCMAGVEGTVMVRDEGGKLVTYNYAGRGKDVQVDCAPYFNKGTLINPIAIGRTRWARAIGEYGDGVKDLVLVPYRTIAVDTLTFPIGSVIYVPAARGQSVTLPDGSTAKHDGYFFAGDIGGAIKQNHIDVFSGTSTKNPFPSIVMSKSSGVFDAYVVRDERVLAMFAGHHKAKK
jgi:3D (Asp-Asp-Asp) domain-containing protein